jgi:hypothetical protein
MEQTALSILTGWANFYVIVGSASAALTGLQFVKENVCLKTISATWTAYWC